MNAQNADTQNDSEGLSEEFLEISPNIFASFSKFRPPVGLHYFDEETNRITRLSAVGDRLGKPEQERAAKYCDERNLYLSRDEYGIFAEHLSSNLGLLLTEPNLTPAEILAVFHKALRKRLEDFLDQPVQPSLDPLENDLAILCEYLFSGEDHKQHLCRVLEKEHTLVNHSVNTLFVGLALFMIFHEGGDEVRRMKDPALGLILHDIGMHNVPDFILGQPRKLMHKERERVEQHPLIGLNMLKRLTNISETVTNCVGNHHERLDGKGYPRGLGPKDMPPTDRICAVADAFCAMIANRVYREALPPKKALLLMLKEKEGYDPKLLTILAHYITKEETGCA